MRQEISRLARPLHLLGYALVVTALLLRGWIPVLLFVIVALIAERRSASDRGAH